jgi:hypothetical protein
MMLSRLLWAAKALVSGLTHAVVTRTPDNRVQLFDPPHAIAWEPGQDTGDGSAKFGGWVWRYDPAFAGPSGTKVSLSYDWSAVPGSLRQHIGFPLPSGPSGQVPSPPRRPGHRVTRQLTQKTRHLAHEAMPLAKACGVGHAEAEYSRGQ